MSRLSAATTVYPRPSGAPDHDDASGRPGVRRRFGCAEPAPPRFRPAVMRPARGSEASRAPKVALRPAVEDGLREADRLALGLRAALDGIAAPLARAAAAFVAVSGWEHLGYARLADYARERLGRSARWVGDLARLGDGLRVLPALAAALAGADGGRPIGRAAASLLAGIAAPESLAAWLRHARSVSVRALRDDVAAARAAASAWPPGQPGDDEAPGDDDDLGDDQAPDAAGAPEDPPAGARMLVRLPVPLEVLGAFDECLDLYRAVEGRETTVTSFVAALSAEVLSRGALGSAPDAPLDPGLARWLTPGQPGHEAIVERALERSTDRWRHLDPARPSQSSLPASPAAARALARLRKLEDAAGTGGAAELDRQLRALLALEDEMDVRLGRLLADMAERGAWTRLRFAGAGHYSEERLGLSRTAGEDRVRAARALRRLRHVRAAYERGRIGLEAALLVSRILGGAAPAVATEKAWVARAEEATVKRLRDEARALGRRRAFRRSVTAAGPSDPPGAAATRPLTDAQWHASLRRAPRTARRRVLWLGFAAIGGDTGLLDPTVAMPVSPDVFLRLRLPAEVALDFLRVVGASCNDLEARAGSVPWDQPWPDRAALPSMLAARTFSILGRRAPPWIGVLAVLEEFVLTWDAEQAWYGRPRHPVMVRDGWRCTAPGCTSRRNLEDHHIRYRSHGGESDPRNRACLCRFHHQRGEHGDLASCEGSAPLGVVWRLGRQATGGIFRNERRIAPDGTAPPPPRPRPGADRDR